VSVGKNPESQITLVVSDLVCTSSGKRDEHRGRFGESYINRMLCYTY
jgi:hypothetical protein